MDVKALRIKSGISIQEIAQELGQEPNQYVFCESRPWEFTLTQADRLCELLGCNINDLNLDRITAAEWQRRKGHQKILV